MVVYVGVDLISKQDLVLAQEEYGAFVKFVIDLDSGDLAIGGEWHVDAEKTLIQKGSKTEHLWGGGVDMNKKEISFSAMTNIKPGINSSHLILDNLIRQKVEELVRIRFEI